MRKAPFANNRILILVIHNVDTQVDDDEFQNILLH